MPAPEPLIAPGVDEFVAERYEHHEQDKEKLPRGLLGVLLVALAVLILLQFVFLRAGGWTSLVLITLMVGCVLWLLYIPLSRVPDLGIWIAGGWLALVVFLAIAAPWLPLKSPVDPGAGPRLPPFTEGHILGTDTNQRDVLSRVIWGARSSLIVSVGAVTIGLVIGGTTGLIAGFRRGRADTILSSVFDILLAFPQLVLALSLVAFLSPPPAESAAEVDASGGLTNIQILILAIGIVAIPLLARITRATTLTWSQREFVTAARAQGAKNLRMMVREVLPNVLPAMFSLALLAIAIAIIAEGGLSLLGVGVEPPRPSWGNMITDNRNVRSAPTNALFAPIAAIFLTVMALNYLGDAIRRKFDVRESAL